LRGVFFAPEKSTMGAWGTGVLSDDSVRDVYDGYLDLFNRGNSSESIRKKLLDEHRESLEDADEGPLVWIGMAKAQWDCGQLEPSVLSKIREIVEGGLGLERWAEQGQLLLQHRKTALNQFLAKLQTSNPRPRKPRKAIKRKPIFQPGDCLAVRLRDGDWSAMLVLKGELESDDPYQETYGRNLVITLRYKNSEMPSLDVFEKREWLYLTHHSWENELEVCNVSTVRFRAVKDRFVHVGSIRLRATDPQTSKWYSGWIARLDGMYLQDRWDRGIRD
jgi:hypothetical protein